MEIASLFALEVLKQQLVDGDLDLVFHSLFYFIIILFLICLL